MGKLLCESTQMQSPITHTLHWHGHNHNLKLEDPDLSVESSVVSSASWDNVPGLDDQQRRVLQPLQTRGVLWKSGEKDRDGVGRSVVFQLLHGGEVSSDGNCLFTACQKAIGCGEARDLRRRAVSRFLEYFESARDDEKEAINDTIQHMYSPDLAIGWGIHIIQEVKFLASKDSRESLENAIDELVSIGMQREHAAESIYRERCIPVNDAESWAKYMSISGSQDDDYHIITLQYTEEGLLSVDDNRFGRAAAFGDDVAIEYLATELNREVYVVQAHGADAMIEEENCAFFLPHRPRREVLEVPFFLFMKGTGWCGAGGDHYEPLIARPCAVLSQERVAAVIGG